MYDDPCQDVGWWRRRIRRVRRVDRQEVAQAQLLLELDTVLQLVSRHGVEQLQGDGEDIRTRDEGAGLCAVDVPAAGIGLSDCAGRSLRKVK